MLNEPRALADAADRDAWLAARRDVLTGSDLASVLGMGSKSRAQVLREKVSGKEEGEDPGELSMVAAGRYLERGVFEWFAAETVHEHAYICGKLYVSPVHDFLAATPDAVMDGQPVEVKNVMFESRPNWHVLTTSKKGWPKAFSFPTPIDVTLRFPPQNLRTAKADKGEPRGNWRDSLRFLAEEVVPQFGHYAAPVKYWVQHQLQMHILSASHGYITCCYAGTGRIDLYYARDDKFLAWAFMEAAEFWAAVKAQRGR